MLGLKLALAASAVGGAAAEIKYTAAAGTCSQCSTAGGGVHGLTATGNTCAASGKACDTTCKTTAKSIALNAVVASDEFCIEGEKLIDVNDADAANDAARTKCMKNPTVVASAAFCTADNKQKCPTGEVCVGATGNAFSTKGTCTKLDATRVGADTAPPGTGGCTRGAFYDSDNAANPTASGKACADGSTCGVTVAAGTVCKAWPTSDIALDAPCRSEKNDGSGSGCAADHYCKTDSTVADFRDGKTWYYGLCKAQTAAEGAGSASHTASCKSPLKLIGSNCVTLPTTDAAVTKWKLDANKACPAALEVFQKLQGNGLNWEKAVPSFKGSCAQITYDASKGTALEAFSVAHPPSQPGTKSTSSAKAECGYCSDACVTAAKAAQTTCAGLLTGTDEDKFRYWTVLPIFAAIDLYLSDVAKPIQLKGVDPCAKDAKVSTGCDVSADRTVDVTAPGTGSTATVKTAAKITEWTTKCAVAYASGGAGQQFASSLAVLALSALAIFA